MAWVNHITKRSTTQPSAVGRSQARAGVRGVMWTEMKRALIALIAMIAAGCSSLGGECRKALDSGEWAVVGRSANALPNDQTVALDQRRIAFLDEGAGILAVCTSCGSDGSRIKSVKYYDNEELVRAMVSTCGPY